MSLIDVFMSPYPNGLHLALLIIGLIAAGVAIYLDRRRYVDHIDTTPLITEVRNPYFNLKPCSCPSGDCPGWEKKAGLISPDPECQLHGEKYAA